MSEYVDGFLIPIPADKIEEYRAIATIAGKLWMEHGALEYRECIGDDLEAKETVPFTAAAGTRPGETVVFSWITYKSREDRDRVNAAVLADPRMQEMMDPAKMPFDCGRMSCGGFTTLVKA